MERKDVLAAGFDGFQPKPISLKALLDEVAQALAQSQF